MRPALPYGVDAQGHVAQRQRAARWRQRTAAPTATAATTTTTMAGTKRPACRIEAADPRPPLTRGSRSTPCRWTARRLQQRCRPSGASWSPWATGGTRVAFDVLDVYRWLRANPDGGICGPFGQVPIDQQQRDGDPGACRAPPPQAPARDPRTAL
ncbi:hypothetical protein TW95_gp1692 [Pandoravirus inopinatum]|uniref:Uncharacterized protein n=1 Tax=Pandoravirus inopinatum TaxID=1605721 RepID=A0A0B5JBM4_9VIRU|nr:hypothetical protein TW95_gp1692 [Pandoravirus inopinatum]AJF98426.1 hypothetical protein [Pandoravirus inopinatum]